MYLAASNRFDALFKNTLNKNKHSAIQACCCKFKIPQDVDVA